MHFKRWVLLSFHITILAISVVPSGCTDLLENICLDFNLGGARWLPKSGCAFDGAAWSLPLRPLSMSWELFQNSRKVQISPSLSFKPLNIALRAVFQIPCSDFQAWGHFICGGTAHNWCWEWCKSLCRFILISNARLNHLFLLLPDLSPGEEPDGQ